MAVNPLYTAVKADFIKKIRLTGAKNEDTLAAIDVAISQVRVGFFNRLTSTRALEIVGYADSDNPTTDDEVTKSTAAVAEALWVTQVLIDLLPQVFMESEAFVRNNWNDEPLTRDAGWLKLFQQNLKNQVGKLLGLLEVPVNQETGPVKAFSTGALTPVNIFNSNVGVLGA